MFKSFVLVGSRLRCYQPWHTVVVGLLISLLSACSEPPVNVDEEPIIRGLKAFRVTQSANSEARRYPSVVQPAQESKLSFEVGGKLKDITLQVGQRVTRGQVLAEIDPVSLQLKVEQTSASLDEANAALRTAKLDFERKSTLLEKNYVTQSEYDTAASQLKSIQAQVEQTRRQLDLAKEDLSKSKLISPFDGVISSVEVQDFVQVGAGEFVLGVYSESGFEVSFSVPASIINSLKVGDISQVKFSDITRKPFSGHIKELGSRAGQVSAFPVVVALDESPVGLRAGMAAEVELTIKLDQGDEGYLVPLSCFYFGSFTGIELANIDHTEIRTGFVFRYDENSQTVIQQAVDLFGIRENMAIVSSGVNEGDIIASAGVSYLHDGQKVTLLPLEN